MRNTAKISDVSAVRQGQVPKIVSLDRIPQRTAEQVKDIPITQVPEEFVEVSEVFFQNRVQQRIVEPIVETPAVSLAEKIVEAPKAQTREKRIHERIIEETDVPAPRVMKETVKVEKLKSQSTLLAEFKFASKPDGSCAVRYKSSELKDWWPFVTSTSC